MEWATPSLTVWLVLLRSFVIVIRLMFTAPIYYTVFQKKFTHILEVRRVVSGQNAPGQNPLGQNPPGQNPLGQKVTGQKATTLDFHWRNLAEYRSNHSFGTLCRATTRQNPLGVGQNFPSVVSEKQKKVCLKILLLSVGLKPTRTKAHRTKATWTKAHKGRSKAHIFCLNALVSHGGLVTAWSMFYKFSDVIVHHHV